jgi:hypothetical protein
MKLLKIGKFLGIVLVLSLILIVIPVSPALAAYDISLSPTNGQVGDTITITGANFPASTLIYFCFSNQAALINQYIGTDVTTYSTVASTTTTTSGTLSTTFVVPSKFSTNNNDVMTGLHYLYATVFTADVPPRQLIVNSTSFNVVGGDISLNPTIGIVDSPVVITGDSFAPSQVISITFGGSAVSIEQGNTSTDSSGNFSSTILIPEDEAGVHNIVVTVSGYSATAQFTIEPDILAFPQSGEPGDTISIIGTGFDNKSVVTIYFNNTPTNTQTLSNNNGIIDIASFAIPDLGLPPGEYFIEAVDSESNSAFTFFTLISTEPTTPPTTTPPTTTTTPPTKTTDLNILLNGNIVAITGTGFTPGGIATFTYQGKVVTTTQIDSAGLFGVTFPAPSLTGGDHIIVVTDGTNTDQVTYSVEPTYPSNPVMETPKSGDKVKKPITFDWDDVTGTSSPPITYTLQISSDATFATDSLLIEKNELLVSTCQLTETEELELTGRDEPYFWRVKATDAAQNDSPWSGPFEFYVSPPFSFPVWATITLAIVGGILLFGLGYWLGRRTAFFY